MVQCLRIFFSVVLPKKLLQKMHEKAKDLNLEGTVQTMQQGEHIDIRIVVCGTKEAIDAFVDYLHVETADSVVVPAEIEPFIKDRDFRGVFRIIE